MLQRVKLWFWSMFCPERFVRHLAEELLATRDALKNAEKAHLDLTEKAAAAVNAINELNACGGYQPSSGTLREPPNCTSNVYERGRKC